MKALLLRDARISHKAGEIVEVSPAEFKALEALGTLKPAPIKKGKKK